MKDYLARINFTGIPRPTLEIFTDVHRLHLYNIPFENLDIHRNTEIVLNRDILSNKILSMGRGGYCYELNGLFYFLLKEIGFNVVMLSARVRSGKNKWGESLII